ncbi:MAG: nucleotidyltransferase family protein, partial [Planctomycetes bacterium]|nr:nucleotidyltransferase family protein [Planctomycetota bacterium]
MNLSGLSPAARAAAAVLRAGLGTGPRPRARPRVPEPDLLGWLTFTGLGSAYRKALRDLDLGGHSPAFLEALEALRHGALARNMVHFAEFGRIHDACRERGIDVLPLKGFPAVVLVHGGDLSMRPMADLDVLVRPGQTEALLGVLEGLGYREAPMPIDPFFGERARHLPPRFHPRRGSMVEVHRGADYDFRGMGRRLMPDFFAGSVAARVDGRDVRLPGWPSWLFQWAVHLAYADAYLNKVRDLYDAAALLVRR